MSQRIWRDGQGSGKGKISQDLEVYILGRRREAFDRGMTAGERSLI